MSNNARLNGSIDQVNLEFVEREAKPQFLMKLSIQLHLAGLSLSNTVSILEMFCVKRARFPQIRPTARRWTNPDHVAVDEAVIRLNDEQDWLDAAVDLETNELLHTKLEPTPNKVIAHTGFAELREKHDVDDAVFLIYGSHSLNAACSRHGLDFRYERNGNRNSVDPVFCEIKRRTTSFSNCFSNAKAETADDWLRSFSFAWNQLT